MDMIYRRLDQNGDYLFGNNKLDYMSGKEAIAQAVKTKICLFYQEWWEDISIGIPMFQSIIGKVSDTNLQMATILLVTQRINEIPEIQSVDKVDVDYNNEDRLLSLRVEITSIYGSDTVEVNI